MVYLKLINVFYIIENLNPDFKFGNKYFIYKGTGGLFHNLKGISRAIKLSIQNNTTLVIDMGCHRIFGGNFNDYFIINCNKLKYCTNYKNLPIDLIDKYKNNGAGHYGYGKNRSSYNKINLSNKVNILYGWSGQSLYNKIHVHPLYF